MIKIFPSLISGNILNLKEEIKILENYCDGFHLDIMDFHFVADLTFGPLFINAISKVTSKQLFVHLMVDQPENWISILKLKKNDIFSFHYESTNEYLNIISEIHNKEWLASIALKPHTPINSIFEFANKLDQILIMTVDPGFSGQEFIPGTIKKIEELAKYRKNNNLKFKIAVDGGIKENNIDKLAELGVDDFAIGSAIFKSQNPINTIEELYKLANI